MLNAQQLRKENIAEYILYLYQIEDLIRAFHLDMDLINDKLIKNYQADDQTSREISTWYENLVVMMEKEGRQQSGHLQFLENLVKDLHEFHLRLMNEDVVPEYSNTYKSVRGIINELRQKNANADSDVQAAIDGIYGYLLLKIQKKEVTAETEQAIKQLSQWLALLSKNYHDFETGDLQM